MRILKNNILLNILSYILYSYIRLTYKTMRWQKFSLNDIAESQKNKNPMILAFWHGRLVMMPNLAPQPENIHVMISRHGDGELIARIISFFKLKLVRGSTNKNKKEGKKNKNRGGMQAIRDALLLLEQGEAICMTPDGPRGPRMRVSGTLIDIASKTEATIFPITFSASWGKNFSSWDRFLLPFPFSKGYIVCGKPIKLTKLDSNSLEEARKQLENSLNDITREADLLAGRKPIEPAEEKV